MASDASALDSLVCSMPPIVPAADVYRHLWRACAGTYDDEEE
jgi:hypothetical protein